MKADLTEPAFIALTVQGVDLARSARAVLGRGVIYAPAGLGGDETLIRVAIEIATLFRAGSPIIGICAAGILMRALAPHLADKHLDPPVLAISEDGAHVVPLLGGHHGANTLARQLAEGLGGIAAITTASDSRFGGALDDLPPGWYLANPDSAKPAMAALLAGEPLSLIVESGDGGWIAGRFPLSDHAAYRLRVTDRAIIVPEPAEMILHPPVLALGLGCERHAEAAEVIALAEESLQEAGLSGQAVACVVSIDIKADEPAIHAAAAHFGVPARFFPAASLAPLKDRLVHPSEIVFRETGCWGVAEGAALAAVGVDGDLVSPKRKSLRATCAIARSRRDIDPGSVGVARGRLQIVGIGPGQAAWRAPEASAAIRSAGHLVGYGLYLDLLGDLAADKTRHETGLGDEEGRARRALDLAAQGQNVALVCSGDAGIYALATLVFDLMDHDTRADWRRVEISVTPGVSAMQAAAARAGAPLGHDFCAISLSDLLTPWDVIERRVIAAAEGDFVIAFYNPRSLRRISQLAAAREILLKHRPSETPVILARNLGRADEAITIVDLAQFDPAQVDMLTLVLVGSSETRRVAGTGWVYTPRGYADKFPAESTAS